MPLKVFISYRRLDTQWPAKTLYDALRLVLPAESIFYDIDSIPPGEDFEQFYKKTAGSCDVLLALIGPQWINAIDEKTGKRRLDDPTDPVRNEIAAALKQKNTTVVPVLFDGTAMPPAARLPPDLQRLPTCNAEFVKRGGQFP
jgi:TIR domain